MAVIHQKIAKEVPRMAEWVVAKGYLSDDEDTSGNGIQSLV